MAVKDDKPKRRSTNTPAPTTDAKFVAVQLPFPLAYLQIIDKEAELVRQRRGKFLSLLARWALKLDDTYIFQRAPNGPTYKFKREELEESERFQWYPEPELVAAIDKARLPFSYDRPTWFMIQIRAWIGQSDGLTIVGK